MIIDPSEEVEDFYLDEDHIEQSENYEEDSECAVDEDEIAEGEEREENAEGEEEDGARGRGGRGGRGDEEDEEEDEENAARARGWTEVELESGTSSSSCDSPVLSALDDDLDHGVAGFGVDSLSEDEVASRCASGDCADFEQSNGADFEEQSDGADFEQPEGGDFEQSEGADVEEDSPSSSSPRHLTGGLIHQESSASSSGSSRSRSLSSFHERTTSRGATGDVVHDDLVMISPLPPTTARPPTCKISCRLCGILREVKKTEAVRLAREQTGTTRRVTVECSLLEDCSCDVCPDIVPTGGWQLRGPPAPRADEDLFVVSDAALYYATGEQMQAPMEVDHVDAGASRMVPLNPSALGFDSAQEGVGPAYDVEKIGKMSSALVPVTRKNSVGNGGKGSEEFRRRKMILSDTRKWRNKFVRYWCTHFGIPENVEQEDSEEEGEEEEEEPVGVSGDDVGYVFCRSCGKRRCLRKNEAALLLHLGVMVDCSMLVGAVCMAFGDVVPDEEDADFPFRFDEEGYQYQAPDMVWSFRPEIKHLARLVQENEDALARTPSSILTESSVVSSTWLASALELRNQLTSNVLCSLTSFPEPWRVSLEERRMLWTAEEWIRFIKSSTQNDERILNATQRCAAVSAQIIPSSTRMVAAEIFPDFSYFVSNARELDQVNLAEGKAISLPLEETALDEEGFFLNVGEDLDVAKKPRSFLAPSTNSSASSSFPQRPLLSVSSFAAPYFQFYSAKDTLQTELVFSTVTNFLNGDWDLRAVSLGKIRLLLDSMFRNGKLGPLDSNPRPTARRLAKSTANINFLRKQQFCWSCGLDVFRVGRGGGGGAGGGCAGWGWSGGRGCRGDRWRGWSGWRRWRGRLGGWGRGG